MNTYALYTFGLLDPEAGHVRMVDFAKRAEAIFEASDHAPGFIGRAKLHGAVERTYTPDDDYGDWGMYSLPVGLPNFDGHDPRIHIATLSVWQSVDSARLFVYKGLHANALKVRHDWFLKGPWPGHVIWRNQANRVPNWSAGARKLETLALDGQGPDHFTFGSEWAR